MDGCTLCVVALLLIMYDYSFDVHLIFMLMYLVNLWMFIWTYICDLLTFMLSDHLDVLVGAIYLIFMWILAFGCIVQSFSYWDIRAYWYLDMCIGYIMDSCMYVMIWFNRYDSSRCWCIYMWMINVAWHMVND